MRRDPIYNARELSKIIGTSTSMMMYHVHQGMPVRIKGSRGVPSMIHAPTAIAWLIDKRVRDKMKSLDRPDPAVERKDRERLVRASADFREISVKRLEERLVAFLGSLFVVFGPLFLFLPASTSWICRAEWQKMWRARQIKDSCTTCSIGSAQA